MRLEDILMILVLSICPDHTTHILFERKLVSMRDSFYGHRQGHCYCGNLSELS